MPVANPCAEGRGTHLHQCARLVEFQTRTTRKELRWITIAKIAQKIGLYVTGREKLLLASFATFALTEKLFVQLRVVEPRHRPPVEPPCTPSKQQINNFQRRAAPQGALDQRRAGHQQTPQGR